MFVKEGVTPPREFSAMPLRRPPPPRDRLRLRSLRRRGFLSPKRGARGG